MKGLIMDGVNNLHCQNRCHSRRYIHNEWTVIRLPSHLNKEASVGWVPPQVGPHTYLRERK